MTPLVATSPYCSPVQFLNRYDVRTVGDLLSDTGTRFTPTQVTNALTYNASTNPDTILAMASGALEAAIIRGNRYLVTDLTNLANTPGNGSAYLASLVADYAMWILLNRRPNRQAPIPQQVQAAFQLYEKLANGEMVLPFLETLAAGDHFERIAQPLTLAALVTDRGHRYFGQLDGCFGPRRC